MESKVYNIKGEEVGKIGLPPRVFSAKWRADLVHQVVESMRSNRRAGTADTKGRGEVRGGGKKPWKQKGTGRARHGSSRSPIWVGGGVTHGPLSAKNYTKKISKSMKAQALFSVLSRKLKDKEIIFIDSLDMDEIKTKIALEVLKNLAKAIKSNRLISKSSKSKSSKTNALVLLSKRNEKTEKSFKNLPQVDLAFLKNINPLDILQYKYLLIEKPEESITFLASR